MKNRYAFLCLFLLISGCASAGVQVKPEQLAALRPGVTTMNDAISRLGSPTGRAISSDGSVTLTYVYSHTQVRPETFIPYIGAFVGGADTQSNAVSLKFGPDGKLIEYSSSDSAIGAGVGFAAGGSRPRTSQPTEAKPVATPDSPPTTNRVETPNPPPLTPTDAQPASPLAPTPSASTAEHVPTSGYNAPRQDAVTADDPCIAEIRAQSGASAKIRTAARLCKEGKITKEERNRIQAAILRGDI